MKFTFYARDFFNNNGNFDFSQDHYETLLAYCFRESSFFSLQFSIETAITKKLSIWEIEEPPVLYQFESHPENRRCYYANDNTHSFLLSISSSVFDFDFFRNCEYPEDLVFYRKDGSVLLDSIAHEGECSIYPDTYEEVIPILHYGHWLYMEGGDYYNEGTPSAPAKEHQLLPVDSWNLSDDSFYNILCELQRLPEKFISNADIEFLLSFINEYFKKTACPPGMVGPNIPAWYRAFRMYLLGECNAKTNDRIDCALRQEGFTGQEAFMRFFMLLNQFSENYFKLHTADT